MLVRTYDGKLVEINRYDYKNDFLYYKKLMEINMPAPVMDKMKTIEKK